MNHTMCRSILFLLFVAMGLIACGKPASPTEEEFRQTVMQWAGEGGQNCGSVELEHSRADAIACAELAIQQNKAFYVIFAKQGVDSSLYTSLARNATGEFQRFNYDSNIYGAGGVEPRSQMTQHPCVNPKFSQSESPLVCS